MKKGDSRSEMKRMNANRGMVTGETKRAIAKVVQMPKKQIIGKYERPKSGQGESTREVLRREFSKKK